MRKTNKLLAKKGGDAIKPGALVSAVDNYKPDEDSLAVIEQVINTTNIDEMNARGETPLYLATMYNYPAEIAEMLIEKGANVNIVRETDKTTPLHNAINKENVDTVKLLLGSDANVNQIYGLDESPLQTAVGKKNKVIIKMLIEKGANVNHSDRDNRKLLDSIIMSYGYSDDEDDDLEIAKLLKDKGATPSSILDGDMIEGFMEDYNRKFPSTSGGKRKNTKKSHKKSVKKSRKQSSKKSRKQTGRKTNKKLSRKY